MLDTTMLCDNVEFINSDFSLIVPGKAIIQSVTSDTQIKTEDRQILVPIGTLQRFAYVRFDDDIWIIVSEPSNNKFYEKAILKIAAQRPIRLDGEIDTLIITENGTKIKTDAGNMLSFLIDSAGYKTAQEENQLIVPRGGEYRITLSDGTRVWLNAASVLTFPPVFAGNERKVRLVGEAFFEVTPDTARPFIVATARMDIKVLGTSFNVSVYEDEETVHTTLVKGSVEVQPVQQEAIMLKPGEQACLAGNRMTVKAVNTRQFTSWIDGKFMFCNTALEEISKQISRWYDVDIFFSSEQVKTICFTGAILRFEPLEELIRMIENTSNVRFSVKGKTIVISEQK